MPDTTRSQERLARDLRAALQDVPPEAQLLVAATIIQGALTKAGLLGDLIQGMHIVAGENPGDFHGTIVPTEKAMLMRMAPYPDQMQRPEGPTGPASPPPPGL